MRITLRCMTRIIVLITLFLIFRQTLYHFTTQEIEGSLILHIEQTGNDEINTIIEPDFSGPVDLVYLWVNGSEPKFILEMKRQKASEDVEKYQSFITCKSPSTDDAFNVIVVFPVLHSTKTLSENKNVEYIYNATDKDLKYSVIIPKNWDKVTEIMRILTVIDGQTYLSMCASISYKNLPQTKTILPDMFIVKTNDLNTITAIMKKISESDAGYVFKYDEKCATGKYAIICYRRHASSYTFKKLIQDLQKFNIVINPAILAWDTDDIKIEGLPNANRYAENDQLIYSIRSVEKYAPWIRHIYIVTNDQRPVWLNTSNERISVVSTKNIFPNKDDLPTFSSPAIESHMYRIPGISETFIFMCDDFFFGQPVTLRDFYTQEEGLKFHWDSDVPTCWFRCFNTLLGNGKCDRSCDNLRCGWDHGECRKITESHIKEKYPLILAGNFKGSVYNTIAMFNRHSSHSEGIHHFSFPPHRPLLVNKQIAADLYKTFKEEFDMSSAIHFRSQFNVQYTMAYLLFVSTAHVAVKPEMVFDELDQDESGTLSVHDLEELRHANLNSPQKDLSFLIDVALDCLRARAVDYENNTFGNDYNSLHLSKSEFLHCHEIDDFIRSKGILKPKYKYTIDTEDNYYFIIIHNIMAKAKWDLNSFISEPKKFVCINDNMDHSKMVATAIEQELKNFYESLFPEPSQYELHVP